MKPTLPSVILILALLPSFTADARTYRQVLIENVPHIRQKPDFCGEACAEMFLAKLGKTMDQDFVFGTIVSTRRMTIGLKDKKRGLRIKGINMLSSTKAKFIPRKRFCVEL